MIITLFCFFFFARGAKIPEPPEGHKWQKVIHDNKVRINNYNDRFTLHEVLPSNWLLNH